MSEMAGEAKKVSFGFSKLTKKSNIITKAAVKKDKIQLIDCLEAQTIKLKDAEEKVKGPLIIPMVQSGNIFDRKREMKLEREIKTEDGVNTKPDSELTADELAARELIREAQNSLLNKESNKVFTLPAVTENLLQLEGKEEPTIDDYEAVPISDYGMAMLRGMGWTEGSGIGKNKSQIKMKEPSLRPKGMGLGVHRGVHLQHEKVPVDKDGLELVLKKGGYAKILEGKHKGSYCEIQGFDDESGRVIVRTSLQGLILSLNEFLVKPVTKEEYLKSSKVINNAKYEEYKIKQEKNSVKGDRDKDLCQQQEHKSSSSRQRTHKSSEDSEERESRQRTPENGKSVRSSKHRSKSKKKNRSSSYSSEGSGEKSHRERVRRLSSSSDHEHKRHHKSKKKANCKSKYECSSDSQSDYDSYRTKKSDRYDKHKKHCKQKE